MPAMAERFSITLSVEESDGVRHDYLLDADGDAALGDLLAALGQEAQGQAVVDGAAIALSVPLNQAGLREGSILSFGVSSIRRDGLFTLEATSGSLAGRRWDLPAGTHQVGRVLGAVLIDHPTVSRLHAELLVDAHAVTVRDLGSSNGTWVNEEAVTRPRDVLPPDVLSFGDVTFRVRPHNVSDASLAPGADGHVVFNRPGRFLQPRPSVTVRVKPPTQVARHVSFPWVTLISPVALALVALFVFRRPEMLFMAAVGPIAAVAQYLIQRRQARREAHSSSRSSEAAAAALAARLQEAIAAEQVWALELEPSVPQMLDAAMLPTTRLWERRASDADFLSLRLGIGRVPSAVRIEGDTELPQPTFAGPIILDVQTAGVVGLGGDRATMRAVARQMLLRAAVYHAPSQLRFVLLTRDDGEGHWAWARWLPHLRGEATPLALGNDSATSRARIEELAKLVDVRTDIAEHQKATRFVPDVLFLAEGARRFRSDDAFLKILRKGPAVGVHTLAIEDDPAQLPEEDGAELTLEPSGSGRLALPNSEVLVDIQLDGIEPEVAEPAARSLAPLVLAGGEDSALPDAVRLLDLLGVGSAEAIKRKWAQGTPSTLAVVGVDAAGTLAVDLVRDGPHALVAGTVGSGKTELLQSLLASLAVANPPDALSFLLIDYKGGGDFAEIARFPHTLGVASSLNERLTRRAIEALRAEALRRQAELADLAKGRLISEANVKSAWREQPAEARRRQLGRLVIVVDEFALFARNLPDFVDGLVQVTDQGRSLGMHVVISVLTPAANLSSKIRDNTGIRVVLRTEHGASVGVLDSAHADLISRRTPGRGYVRLGDPPRLVEFQAARVGGLRPDMALEQLSVEARHLEWSALGRPFESDRQPKSTAGRTDLAMLSELLERAAEGYAIPDSPWPAPLPPVLTLADLDWLGEGPVRWGLVDRPSARDLGQKRVPLVWDLSSRANMALVGMRGSGRGRALAALACALAAKCSPDNLHLVPLDFAGDLAPLEALPHVGSVPVNDLGRFARHLELLVDEIRRRQQGGRGPQVLALINRYEAVASRIEIGSELETLLHTVLRDGPLVGIRTIAAGDESLLSPRLQSLFENRALLKLLDKTRYQELGISPRQVPDDLPPGRGYLAPDGVEVQFAFAGDEGDGTSGLEAAVCGAAQRWLGVALSAEPTAVLPLPARIAAAEARAMPAPGDDGHPLSICVGIGGDRVSRHFVNLSHAGGGFVVAGPRASGKSTALVWIAEGLLERGTTVVAIAGSGRGPLAGLEGRAGVAACFTAAPTGHALESVLKAVKGPVVILVDDAPELIRRTAGEQPSPIALIRPFVLDVRGVTSAAVIVSGEMERLQADPRGAIALALNTGAGLLLAPDRQAARALGLSHLPSRFDAAGPAGRGVLIDRGAAVAIQVPTG
jgi:S-DNA-T family DNA segregation ATPase FtsK/SpoIIIE